MNFAHAHQLQRTVGVSDFASCNMRSCVSFRLGALSQCATKEVENEKQREYTYR
jgi:hypothetical protein